MAKNKQKEEMVKNDVTPPLNEKENASETPKTEGAPKKKSNALWYIIGGVVLLLILIPVVGFFVVRGLIQRGVDTIEDYVEYDQVIEDSDFDMDEPMEWELEVEEERTDVPSLDGELEEANKINSRFPEDIPLPGGKVSSSRYSSDYVVEVQLHINSDMEEILDWYEEEIEEMGWTVTQRSSSGHSEDYGSGRLRFESDDGERSFEVSLSISPYQDYTSATVKEWLY